MIDFKKLGAIRATDLRIGNHVLFFNDSFPGENKWEEVIVLPAMIVDASERPEKYAPLSLSHERLHLLGLHKQKDATVTGLPIYANMKLSLVIMNTADPFTDFEVTYSPSMAGKDAFLWRMNLKVHELQNLYYALTKRELKD